MSDPDAEFGSRVISVAMEYLLDVRQRQLGEELSEASRRGDREWGWRLRLEIDFVSRILQSLRAEREQAGISPPVQQSRHRLEEQTEG